MVWCSVFGSLKVCIIWISSWAAPLFSQLADNAGLSFVQEGQQATTLALGNLGIWVPTMLAQDPTLVPVLLVGVIVLTIYIGKRIENRHNQLEREE